MIKLQDGGDRQVGQGLFGHEGGWSTLRLRIEAVPKGAAPVTSPAQGGSNLVLAREINCDRGKNKPSGNESPSCSRGGGREV